MKRKKPGKWGTSNLVASSRERGLGRRLDKQATVYNEVLLQWKLKNH